MRQPTTKAKIESLMARLGELATGEGTIYLVGGASALLHGWRDTTLDVDMKLLPEPKGVFEAIAKVKDELQINIELASPDNFIPPLPGWESRSPFIEKYGPVTFKHFDFYSQALAKIERGHDRDVSDVHEMLHLKLIETSRLKELFEDIRSNLVRYPSLDEAAFDGKLRKFLADANS
jgi:hypothetical protein